MGAVANAANLATDPLFRNMAMAGLVYTARTVLLESVDTVNHDRRVWFANRAIRSPLTYADTIAWVSAVDPQISTSTSVATVNENTLLNRIAAAWDYLAGTAGMTNL